jgi:hypothetical protein
VRPAAILARDPQDARTVAVEVTGRNNYTRRVSWGKSGRHPSMAPAGLACPVALSGFGNQPEIRRLDFANHALDELARAKLGRRPVLIHPAG